MAARLTANVPKDSTHLIRTLLAVTEILPRELASREGFRRPILTAVTYVQSGARATIETYAALAG